MKALKAFALGAVALFIAASAQAQTIYLTGSTAYRTQTVTAIYDLMAANSGTVLAAYQTGKNPTSANAVILSGTISGVGAVTVSCSWSGSAGGVVAVGAVPQGSAPAITAPFIVDSGSNAAVPTALTSLTTGGTTTYPNSTAIADPTAAGNANTAHVCQIAMSDAFQVSTPFPKNLILTAQDGSGNTYKMAKLTDNVVGVIPFNFFASKGAATAGAASTGITNMTPQLAQGLWPTGNGKEPLSLFTGNPADSTTFCYATGRNPDSGTRINAFAETGVGISSVVQQYVPTISGGAITSLALFPATTLYNVLPVAAGNNGESSGGNLDTDLEAAATNSTGYLIGYLGTSDSTTSLVGGAVQLAYNGVSLPNSGSPSYTFSNFSLIQNGQYTYWGYEHLDYLSTLSTTFPTAYSFANAVVTEIHNVTAQVPVTSMNVGRTIEGGEITLGNPY